MGISTVRRGSELLSPDMGPGAATRAGSGGAGDGTEERRREVVSNPRRGQLIRVRYGKRWRAIPRFQDAMGWVVIPSHGKPRNHLVKIGGKLVIVPAGNLMPAVE